LDFGKNAAESVGMANAEFNQLATVTGATLGAFIDDSQDVADETLKLSERAADMASVFNTSVPEAMTAVGAALRGESEPIRRFGVQLDDASVKAKAVEMGLAATTAQVTMQHKGLARLELIYEQTNKTAGDFANTSDSISNRQKILSARWEDAKAALGEGLAPVLEGFLGLLESSIPLIETAAVAIGGLVDLMMGTDLTNLQDQYAEINQLIADGATEAEAAQQVLGSHLAPAMSAVASATWEAAQAAAAHDVAARGEAGAIDGVAGATKSLANEVRKATDPAFALRDAQEKMADASKKVDDIRATGATRSKELIEALADESEAQADLNYATEKYEEAGIAATDGLFNLGLQAGQTREEIELLIGSLERLGEVPVGDISIGVQTDLSNIFGGGGGGRDVARAIENELAILDGSRRPPTGGR